MAYSTGFTGLTLRMAYFTASDEIRTLKYLGYPNNPGSLNQLRSLQQAAYNTHGDAIVVAVESILTELDNLETIEGTFATDTNSSLIKADVLEWNPVARQANLEKRRQRLVNQLSTIFSMQVFVSYGSTPVYRG